MFIYKDVHCTLSKYLATGQGKVRHDPRLHPAVTVSSRQEQSNLNVIRPGQGVACSGQGGLQLDGSVSPCQDLGSPAVRVVTLVTGHHWAPVLGRGTLYAANDRAAPCCSIVVDSSHKSHCPVPQSLDYSAVGTDSAVAVAGWNKFLFCCYRCYIVASVHLLVVAVHGVVPPDLGGRPQHGAVHLRLRPRHQHQHRQHCRHGDLKLGAVWDSVVWWGHWHWSLDVFTLYHSQSLMSHLRQLRPT